MPPILLSKILNQCAHPSLHGEGLEQNTHISLSYPYIVKSLEYKYLLPHNEGDPCYLNSFMITYTCKRM